MKLKITLPDWLFPIGVVIVVAAMAYSVGYYHASPPATTWMELRGESVQGSVLTVHYWKAPVLDQAEKVGQKHFNADILYIGDSYDQADIVEATAIVAELHSYQNGKKLPGIEQVNLFRSFDEYSWIRIK